VRKYSLEQNKKRHNVFCPLGYYEWQRVLEPERGLLLDEGVYVIHLWNEKWRAAGQDKNAQYQEDCLYEKLKRKYLGVSRSKSRPVDQLESSGPISCLVGSSTVLNNLALAFEDVRE
jgi:hypothetical protein